VIEGDIGGGRFGPISMLNWAVELGIFWCTTLVLAKTKHTNPKFRFCLLHAHTAKFERS
jgi:hypothetical protein